MTQSWHDLLFAHWRVDVSEVRRAVPDAFDLDLFDDEAGPPSYRLNREGQATVLLFVKQKVVANFAFRGGEITDAKIAEVTKALDLLKK